jgi:hypothetical protein
MFSIFNKRDAAGNGNHRSNGHAVAAPPRVKKISDIEETFHLDIPVDDAMRAVDSRLSSLSHIEVSQAAKERGWATLHRELERHPVRPTAAALLKGTGAKTAARPGGLQPIPVHHGHSRGWRIGLSSAGAVVVILAAVLGVYGAGLLSDGTGPFAVTTTVVIADTSSTTSTEVVTSTDSTDSSDVTVTTQAPDTTETTPVTTDTPTTGGTSTSTPTTGGTTVTTEPTTPTTKPASTPTTGATISVSADRVRDAQVMAALLAKAVIDYFAGVSDISDVARHVAPSAQPSLTQMIGRLDNPANGQVVPNSAKAIDANTVRFTLEFVDVDDTLRFFVKVHVDDQGATITGISAAS